MSEHEHPPATNPIVMRIDEACARAGLTRRGVSIKADLSPEFVRKLEERGPRASANYKNLLAIANALDVSVDWLTWKSDDMRQTISQAPAFKRSPDIPILGLAAGSAIGSFQVLPGNLGYVSRPPALEHVEDAYALYVENESMIPMFMPGGLVFVHPHKPTKRDDVVIIQVRDETGKIESFIKILVRRGAEWVVARQLNPEAEIRFKASTVVAVHKVPDMAELFNA